MAVQNTGVATAGYGLQARRTLPPVVGGLAAGFGTQMGIYLRVRQLIRSAPAGHRALAVPAGLHPCGTGG